MTTDPTRPDERDGVITRDGFKDTIMRTLLDARYEKIVQLGAERDAATARAERAERDADRLREAARDAWEDLQNGRVIAGKWEPSDPAYRRVGYLILGCNDAQIKLDDALRTPAEHEDDALTAAGHDEREGQ